MPCFFFLVDIFPWVQQWLSANRPSGLVSAESEADPEAYELLSVLVHSGGAMGGHYFSYIRREPG